MSVIGSLVVSIVGDNKKLDKALKGSQKQIKGFTKLGMAAGVMLGNLAAKGIAFVAKASIQAVKKLARFTKEIVVMGQKSLELRKSFDSLTKSFGANSKEILKSMSKAAKGTISDMKLMQLANQAMLLGLKPELFAEMVEVARRTAKATGQDINYLFESIVTGLGRQSKMILDNLGIVFDASTAYEWYAESLGKTVSQLTESEKKLGWQSYALEIARENVKRLGKDTLTLTEIGAIFSTTWDNLKALIGEKLVKAIGKVVEKFGGWEKVIAGVQKFIDDKVVPAFDNLILRLKEFGIKIAEADYSEFIIVVKELGSTLGSLSTSITKVSLSMEEGKSSLQGFLDVMLFLLGVLKKISQFFEILIDILKWVVSWFLSLGKVILTTIGIFIEGWKEGTTFTDRLIKGFSELSLQSGKIEDINNQCIDLIYSLGTDLVGAIERFIGIQILPKEIIINHNFPKIESDFDILQRELKDIKRTITYSFKAVGIPTGAGWTGLARYQFGGIIPSTQAILAHRGEMLLTPRDQRNLFNLLQRPLSKSTTYSTPITIENLAVREEADIYKVADQLHELQLITQRGGGLK